MALPEFIKIKKVLLNQEDINNFVGKLKAGTAAAILLPANMTTQHCAITPITGQ
jgi:hypothetical protein